MTNNQTTTINEPIVFNATLVVEVWDKDNPSVGDADDQFGTVTITAAGNGSKNWSFRAGGALRKHNYTLKWQ